MTRYFLLLIFLFTSFLSQAYPLDGYIYTKIPRLVYHYNLLQDSIRSSTIKHGAKLGYDEIQLTLEKSSPEWPKEDAKMRQALAGIFSRLEPQYSISVMDLTDPNNLKFAGIREEVGYQPGSVGKIAIAVGLFRELERAYGDDWVEIIGVLQNPQVHGGPWVISDHHTIPLYDIEKDEYSRRQVIPKDVFSLYTWLDHMFSKSNNAAASVLWREAILVHIYGDQYECLSREEAVRYFEITPKTVLADIANDIINCPLRELGIGENEWRLGSFFTGGADRIVPGKGGSIGTTKGLMKFLFELENGRVINSRTSLEIKRLMYMTDRRIRYAASHSLNDAAVYFKSGSLYSFKDEPGYVRKNYAGNRWNYMNSVAIVEKLDDSNIKYIVVLMSNVLRKNSVNEHYGLAASIDKMIRAAHEQ